MGDRAKKRKPRKNRERKAAAQLIQSKLKCVGSFLEVCVRRARGVYIRAFCRERRLAGHQVSIMFSLFSLFLSPTQQQPTNQPTNQTKPTNQPTNQPTKPTNQPTNQTNKQTNKFVSANSSLC